ncbi:MAG TPA: phosphoribosyltransferase [Solirubrobacterales bacterium]|nr:phosphoribosyltransferase [Solirubrobacterales bacterium]
MIEELERRQPDYLIPVETKGARVLEAVMRFAREELGEPLVVPVIYASALAYMDPERLANSRVVIIDDAVRTGGSLKRHRTRIEGYGPTVIEAIACVGDAGAAHPGADCYRSVDVDSYREHVWQLAELVVARGLPPEVDHHLFELRLPGRLERSWWALKALLRDHGTLTVDAPDIEGETLQPITLHFPDFPGVLQPGPDIPHKVRFFPDPCNDCVYVVPVSFPPVDLEPPTDEGGIPPELWRFSPQVARQVLSDATGSSGSVGSVLVDQAEVLDPETIFAAASTTVEFDLIRGLKALLGRALPEATLRFQTDQYLRLYGPEAAPSVVEAIDDGLASVTRAAEPEGPDPGADEAFAEKTPFLDHEIAQKTRLIAEQLRTMHEEAKAQDRVFPPRRVGLSMRGLTDLVGDPLIASRCVDYGLAMTTLVPFVHWEGLKSGLRLERRYRVSEPREDGRRPYGDMTEVREALSAEMLASICFCVAERSESYRGKPLDSKLLASLVGILRGLVCEEHSIELRALPASEWEQIILCKDDRPLTLEDHGGDMLIREKKGVRASDRFRKEWTANELRLDERNSTEDIEEHVALLIGFLDDMDSAMHRDLLRAWALCTDRRLGLTHVRSSLDAALAASARAAKQVKSEEEHSAAEIAWEGFTDAATEKLRILNQDWAAPVRERWKERPSKRQRRVLGSLGAPDPAFDVYEIPRRFVDLVRAIAPLADRLNGASARLWEGEPAPDDENLVVPILEACAWVRAALSSLDDDYEPLADPPTHVVNA